MAGTHTLCLPSCKSKINIFRVENYSESCTRILNIKRYEWFCYHFEVGREAAATMLDHFRVVSFVFLFKSNQNGWTLDNNETIRSSCHYNYSVRILFEIVAWIPTKHRLFIHLFGRLFVHNSRLFGHMNENETEIIVISIIIVCVRWNQVDLIINTQRHSSQQNNNLDYLEWMWLCVHSLKLSWYYESNDIWMHKMLSHKYICFGGRGRGSCKFSACTRVYLCMIERSLVNL